MLEHTAPVRGPAAAFPATKEPKGSLAHSEDVPMSTTIWQGDHTHIHRPKEKIIIDRLTLGEPEHGDERERDRRSKFDQVTGRLVEEFMLLANMAVAHKIFRTFPEQALLRRHPPPQTKMLSDLVEFCEQMGLPMDVSSAGALNVSACGQKSLTKTFGDDKYSLARKEVLTNMYSRPMQMALYFCSGMLQDQAQFRHYALNVPLYTHFTSPIRRFADVIVHRLLAAALATRITLSPGYSEQPDVEPDTLQKQADHCNDRRMASKRVQELSIGLFFAVLVKESGPLESEAMVMGVLNQAFDVLVLRFGVQKRIYCNALALRSYHFEKVGKKPELTLLWEAEDREEEPTRQVITIFSLVDVVLQAEATALKYSAILKRPGPERSLGLEKESDEEPED
ncbi:hypothetical protein A6R68_23419 [Neotoma lepida]|uniref:RNB domain-containing protein n=1 Tax=Neotoma lepida TaxID=56216 RepID=A0A1A6HX67_NEOLE|nr:hypothetical protein A6R68_23419 [Neotoma lepida]